MLIVVCIHTYSNMCTMQHTFISDVMSVYAITMLRVDNRAWSRMAAHACIDQSTDDDDDDNCD